MAYTGLIRSAQPVLGYLLIRYTWEWVFSRPPDIQACSLTVSTPADLEDLRLLVQQLLGNPSFAQHLGFPAAPDASRARCLIIAEPLASEAAQKLYIASPDNTLQASTYLIGFDCLNQGEIRCWLQDNPYRTFSAPQAKNIIELLQQGRFNSAEAVSEYMVLLGISRRPDVRIRPIPELM